MKEFENMQQKQSLGINLKKIELGSKENVGSILIVVSISADFTSFPVLRRR